MLSSDNYLFDAVFQFLSKPFIIERDFIRIHVTYENTIMCETQVGLRHTSFYIYLLSINCRWSIPRHYDNCSSF
jgi:hypothetical protein